MVVGGCSRKKQAPRSKEGTVDGDGEVQAEPVALLPHLHPAHSHQPMVHVDMLRAPIGARRTDNQRIGCCRRLRRLRSAF
eukprot:15119218-Alexandrium_andersonii.AAC.1